MGRLTIMENYPKPDFEYKSVDGRHRLRVSGYSGKITLEEGTDKKWTFPLQSDLKTLISNPSLEYWMKTLETDFNEIMQLSMDSSRAFPVMVRDGKVEKARDRAAELRTMTSMKTMGFSMAPNPVQRQAPKNHNFDTSDEVQLPQLLKNVSIVNVSFKESVGWCHFLDEGFFLTLFMDGSSLFVDAKANFMYYSDFREKVCKKYRISSSLPIQVKEKLRLFSGFIDDKENIQQ